MTRHAYRLSLDPFTPSGAPAADTAMRHPSAADQEALAVLMLEAYRGTADDDGETIADARREVESYFAGASGRLLLDCSWMVEENGRAASACLASLWQGVPLIAYVMTAGPSKRRGLARQALEACLAGLKAAGYSQVRAVISAGNVPSEQLFTQQGFNKEVK